MENAENQWRLDLQSVLNETNQLTISASGTNLKYTCNGSNLTEIKLLFSKLIHFFMKITWKFYMIMV